MKLPIKKKLQFIVSIALTSLLNFTQACYANTTINTNSSQWIAATAAGGLTTSLLAFLAFSNNNNNQSPTPASTGGPVILTSSNHNLLSENGRTATGKIIVRNGSNTAQKFDITNDISPIITTASSCVNLIEPGQNCSFDISYTGDKNLSSRTPITLIVNGSNNTTDTTTINAISLKPNTLFNPSLDSTNAKGSDHSVQSVIKINKNGVDFLYVGTTNSGVMKSSDGENWTPVNNGLTNLNIPTIYLINNILYAGTFGDGVFKSIDGGEHWTAVSTLPDNSKYISSLSSIGDYLYAATSNGADGTGVYKINLNDPTSWITVNDGLTDLNIGTLYTRKETQTDRSSIDVMYAMTTNSGIFKTINKTDKWIQTTLTNITAYSFLATDSYLYVGADSAENIAGVYRSNDNGLTWDQPPSSSPLYNQIVLALYSVKDQSLNETIYAGTFSSGVYKSTDKGDSWTKVNPESLGQPRIYTLFSLAENLYVGSSGRGIYKTNLSGTSGWSAGNIRLPYKNVRALYSINNILYAGSGNTGVFQSNDKGANWKSLGIGTTNNTVLSLYSIKDTSLNDILYEGTQNYSEKASYNHGVFKINLNDPSAIWSKVNYNTFTYKKVSALTAINGSLYAGTLGSGVYNDVNIENKPNQINTGLTDLNINSLYSIGNRLFSGIGSGSGTGGVFVFDSSNNSWSSFGTGLANKMIPALYYSVSSDNMLYAAANGTTNNGVYKIDPNNSTPGPWTMISNSGLPDVGAMQALSAMDNDLYVSKGSGVFKINPTSSESTSWIQVENGTLPNTVIDIPTLYSVDNELYVGTNPYGIYKVSK